MEHRAQHIMNIIIHLSMVRNESYAFLPIMYYKLPGVLLKCKFWCNTPGEEGLRFFIFNKWTGETDVVTL